MKKALAIILAIVLLMTGCTNISNKEQELSQEASQTPTEILELNYETVDDYDFSGLNDINLLRYVEDRVYSDLIADLNSDQYFIENVNAVYVSKEYIEETAYNSQVNIFFGYTLAELDDYFGDTKYAFTVNEEGQTVVQKIDVIDDIDIYDQIIKDVAIGAGVILVTVTVSCLTAGLGAPAAVTAICAASATGAITFAKSGAIISAVSAGAVKLYETQDVEAAAKAAITAGAEGFKWGAITGVAIGGAAETIGLKIATKAGLSMNDAAIIQKESGYPLDLIKQIKSIEEYNIYKKAGLYTKMINGRLALVRDIDTNFISELPNGERVTNLVRMQKGYAPIDPSTGKAYQLHHINQKNDATLAILTTAEHQGNSAILNTIDKKGEIDKVAFKVIRENFWKQYAALVVG